MTDAKLKAQADAIIAGIRAGIKKETVSIEQRLSALEASQRLLVDRIEALDKKVSAGFTFDILRGPDGLMTTIVGRPLE